MRIIANTGGGGGGGSVSEAFKTIAVQGENSVVATSRFRGYINIQLLVLTQLYLQIVVIQLLLLMLQVLIRTQGQKGDTGAYSNGSAGDKGQKGEVGEAGAGSEVSISPAASYETQDQRVKIETATKGDPVPQVSKV